MSAHDEQQAKEDWLIWSFEHNAWWGPNSGGYYTELRAAGLYTEAEAKRIEASANRGGVRNEEARHISTQAEAIRYALPRYVKLAEVLGDESLLAALRRASPETGWQPMETAPKDGTQLLLWINGIEPRPRIGYWSERGSDTGWYGLQSQHFIGVIVTHWQPLPPAPRPQEAE